MNTQDDFRRLMLRVQTGDPEAAQELYERYGEHLLRVVRRRLHHPLRTRFDSQDFVQDVWKSFFSDELTQRDFESPSALVAFLIDIAQKKVSGAYRQHAGTAKRAMNRDRSLDDSQAFDKAALAATQATPSQVVMAEEQWERLLRNQPPQYQRMLLLLRHGYTHAEIAEKLQTTTKTVQRLLRRIDPQLAP